MASQDADPEHLDAATAQSAADATRGGGVRGRLRERVLQHKQARLTGARGRRELVRWLRVITKQSADSDSIRRSRDVLLHYRAAAVRADLLEIAAMLERCPDPEPDCLIALSRLLADGCDSPLYNAEIDVSELYATLDQIRAGLSYDAPSQASAIIR
jgi:hypothetical protein